jgi:hypothetical protein
MTSGDPKAADSRLTLASAWFGKLQTRVVSAMESLECEFDGANASWPGRFTVEPWIRTDPSGWSWWWRTHGDAPRPTVRKDGRALVDRSWRLSCRVRGPDSGSGERSSLLGGRPFLDCSSVEPVRPHHPCERGARADHQDMVWWRNRSYAHAGQTSIRGRSRYCRVSCGDARRLQPPSRGCRGKRFHEWCGEYFWHQCPTAVGLRRRREPTTIR